MIPRIFAVAFLTGGLVSAASISSGCLSALNSVLNSPDSACLNPSGIVSLIGDADTPESVIAPINSWLIGMCALNPCSNATIATITTNITAGCAAELESLGLTSNASVLIPQAQRDYPPVREVFCLEHTTTGTLCLTEGLIDIQTVVGTIAFNNITDVAQNFPSLDSFPPNVTCTDCNKATYNILIQNFPKAFAGLTAPLESECGSSFIDGQTPPDISESTGDTSTTGSTGTSTTATNPTGTNVADTHTTSTNTTGAALALSAGYYTGIAFSLLVVTSSSLAFLA